MRTADVLIVDPCGNGSLTLRPHRTGDRALARAFGPTLDRRLAAGRSPESSRLIAARANRIVELECRVSLAGDWERILDIARRRPSSHAGALRVRRDMVAAAEPEIRQLIGCLREPLPVPARGVAMARVLLTDGTGPLFSRLSRITLRESVTRALSLLDPALPLLG
jgi:hypothetical protein